MIYKCRNCGGALIYDAISGRMKCEYCGTFYDIKEEEESDFRVEMKRSEQEMDINVYTCSSCGAELMISGTESSTFCSFCGQPTIVFNRIAREQRPDKIIPFSISESQALAILKEKLGGNKYVPEEIKNATIEKVHGIYMPYWIYDIHAHCKHKVVRADGKHSSIYYREENADFHMTYDASGQLSDWLSNQIQQFDLQGLKTFDPGYLSGYYADKYDMPSKSLQKQAKSKVYEAMNRLACNDIRKHFGGNPYAEPLLEESDVQNVEYALFPAYFVTMNSDNKAYHVLINGQTGKIAACLPADPKAVRKHKVKYSLVSSIVFSLIFIGFLFLAPIFNDAYVIFFIPLLEVLFVVIGGKSAKKRFQKGLEEASSASMNTYTSRERG